MTDTDTRARLRELATAALTERVPAHSAFQAQVTPAAIIGLLDAVDAAEREAAEQAESDRVTINEIAAVCRSKHARGDRYRARALALVRQCDKWRAKLVKEFMDSVEEIGHAIWNEEQAEAKAREIGGYWVDAMTLMNKERQRADAAEARAGRLAAAVEEALAYFSGDLGYHDAHHRKKNAANVISQLQAALTAASGPDTEGAAGQAAGEGTGG